MSSTRSSATIFDRARSQAVVFRGAAARLRPDPGRRARLSQDGSQAYRNDRFTGWVPAPGANGYLLPGYNYDSLIELRPVDGSVAGRLGIRQRAGLAVGRGDRHDRGGRDRLGAPRPSPRARRGVEASPRPATGRRGRGLGSRRYLLRKVLQALVTLAVRAHPQLLPVPGAARATRSGCSPGATSSPSKTSPSSGASSGWIEPLADAVRHVRAADAERQPGHVAADRSAGRRCRRIRVCGRRSCWSVSARSCRTVHRRSAIGIKGGWKRGSTFDTSTLYGSLVLYSMPEGWLGMLLLLLFSGFLGWFPAGGYETGDLTGVAQDGRHPRPSLPAAAHAHAGLYRGSTRSSCGPR